MDAEFWTGLAVNIAGLYLGYRQLRLQQKSVERRPLGSRERDARANRRIARLWPVLAMTALIPIAWAPYVLTHLWGSEAISVDNAEQKVRSWLDHFGIGSRITSAETPDAKFSVLAEAGGGRRIAVAQLKKFDRYLVLQSTVSLGPDHKTLFDTLGPARRETFLEKVQLEMSRAGVDTTISLSPTPTFSISKRLAIDAGLTEHEFMLALDAVAIAWVLARDAIVLSLKEVIVMPTIPTPATKSH